MRTSTTKPLSTLPPSRTSRHTTEYAGDIVFHIENAELSQQQVEAGYFDHLPLVEAVRASTARPAKNEKFVNNYWDGLADVLSRCKGRTSLWLSLHGSFLAYHGAIHGRVTFGNTEFQFDCSNVVRALVAMAEEHRLECVVLACCYGHVLGSLLANCGVPVVAYFEGRLMDEVCPILANSYLSEVESSGDHGKGLQRAKEDVCAKGYVLSVGPEQADAVYQESEVVCCHCAQHQPCERVKDDPTTLPCAARTNLLPRDKYYRLRSGVDPPLAAGKMVLLINPYHNPTPSPGATDEERDVYRSMDLTSDLSNFLEFR